MRNTQLKVVIADSNLQERESKQLSMEARGMKVILSTGDGNKVLKVINDGKADIVVMDMVLSGVDGIGILEESRNICEKKPTRESEGSLGNIFRKNAREYEPARAINNVCSGNLEIDVTNLLLEIGIPAHIKGYQYIREGIMLSFYDKNMLHYITKCLYPTIAKKYKTTSSSVERTIRHAIEVAFRRGNRQVLEEIFSNTICSKKTKPTNSEFIALLTDKLRLEYRTRNAS